MSSYRINEAVRDCLARCYEADNATCCVAAFMQELRATKAWTEKELSLVYSTVLRMLRAINADPQDHLSPLDALSAERLIPGEP